MNTGQRHGFGICAYRFDTGPARAWLETSVALDMSREVASAVEASVLAMDGGLGGEMRTIHVEPGALGALSETVRAAGMPDELRHSNPLGELDRRECVIAAPCGRARRKRHHEPYRPGNTAVPPIDAETPDVAVDPDAPVDVPGCRSISTVVDTCTITASGPLVFSESGTYDTGTFLFTTNTVDFAAACRRHHIGR